MISCKRCILGFMVLLGLFVFKITAAGAHGTAHRILPGSQAVTVEFSYSDGEPMGYVSVLVFSPEGGTIEYQNGRTDRMGRFSFYPEIPGTWRIEASDGMGHKESGNIEIKAEKDLSGPSPPLVVEPQTPDGLGSKLLKMIAGLSLILNICLGVALLKAGRKIRQFTQQDE